MIAGWTSIPADPSEARERPGHAGRAGFIATIGRLVRRCGVAALIVLLTLLVAPPSLAPSLRAGVAIGLRAIAASLSEPATASPHVSASRHGEPRRARSDTPLEGDVVPPGRAAAGALSQSRGGGAASPGRPPCGPAPATNVAVGDATAAFAGALIKLRAACRP